MERQATTTEMDVSYVERNAVFGFGKYVDCTKSRLLKLLRELLILFQFNKYILRLFYIFQD